MPSSPGFIGVYQFAGQQALVLPFGTKYDASTALAIALVSHLAYYLLTSVIGVIGLWQMGETSTAFGRAIRSRPRRAEAIGRGPDDQGQEPRQDATNGQT